jgi:Plasmid pRiA4b ORF-3-like protein
MKPEMTPVPTETATSPRAVWEEPNAVQIRVSLDGVEPAIYRRLVVPLDTTLAQLHRILQAAMGWRDSHFHQFEIGGLRFGDPELLNRDRPDDFQQAFDSSSVRLRDFHFDHVGELFFGYLYDFGDSWQHTVALEKLLAVKPAPKTATCIEGARSCPPENVGGTCGYFEFLRVLLNPEPDELEEQRQLKRWCGGRFNPEQFDLAKTDKAVRGALRRRPRE